MARRILTGSVFLMFLLAARAALASDLMEVFTHPVLFEYFPDKQSATRVVIHGGFTFVDKNGVYGPAACGYMYFECKPGEEDMCRMQWHDLETQGIPDMKCCVGFGNRMSIPSTATLRKEGAPLGAPDAWNLGMGIGWGCWIGNRCAEAHALGCKASPVSTVDGGVVDLAPAPDLAQPVKADMAAPADLAAAPVLARQVGCSAGGNRSSDADAGQSAALIACLLGIALLLRRGLAR